MYTKTISGALAPQKLIRRAGKVFSLCPLRHVTLTLSMLVLALYFFLRSNQELMQSICENIARPFQNSAAKACSYLPFSLAELLYAIVIAAALGHIIYTVISIIRFKEALKRLYVCAITLLTASLAIYAGICLLWGSYFYGYSFEEKSGIDAKPVADMELELVTAWFAHIANEYSSKVQRDDNGGFSEPMEDFFGRAAEIYRGAQSKYPVLSGPEVSPKPMFFSKIMSYMNFTGFFFPFTGEANINIDCPAVMIPATIAHEIAHQRGVAKEDEANFTAVMASLESGDPTYIYSAALLAYIHLENELHRENYDSWLEIYMTLNEQVRYDLDCNYNYWKEYETEIANASEAVYTSFLVSQGEELGIKSYGACIDLLVSYYGETASNFAKENEKGSGG